MTNRLKNILKTFIIFAAFTTAPLIGKAQIDTIMKGAPAVRLLAFWQIAESSLYTSSDTALVYRKLDTLQKAADAKDDERLKWYCKFAGIVYKGRKLHDLHKEIDHLYSVADWVKACPLEVIQASYKHKLGILLYTDKRTSEAFNLLLQAQSTFEKIGFNNIPEIFQYLSEMAGTYYHFGDYKNAIKYAKLAEKYPPIFENMYVNVLNTAGLGYTRLNDYSNAGLYFLKGIKAAEKSGDHIWAGISSGNYGYVLMMQEDYPNGIKYLLYDYNSNKNSLPEDAAIAALDLAKCYTKTGKLALAKNYLLEAERLKSDGHDANFYLTYYRYLYRYYGEEGNDGLAYKYADSALQISDSLNSIKAGNLITTTAKRIETENYLSNLALHAEQEKNRLVVKNIIIISISLLMAFLLLLVFSRYKSITKDKKLVLQQQRILTIENQAIAEKLKTSETLLNSYVRHISDKNRLIENINAELKFLRIKNAQHPETEKFEKIATLLDTTILTEDGWQKFKLLFDSVHPHFFIALKNRLPSLTPAETRLLALMKLKLSNKEMSSMVGVSLDTITKTKYRLRKKLADSNIDSQPEEFVDTLQ